SPSRNLQPRAIPEPVGAVGSHSVSVASQKDSHLAVAIPRVLRGQLGHATDRRRVLRRQLRPIPQRRPRDSQQRARPATGQSAPSRVLDLLPPAGRAYHFFALISFITSSSRSRSATIF